MSSLCCRSVLGAALATAMASSAGAEVPPLTADCLNAAGACKARAENAWSADAPPSSGEESPPPRPEAEVAFPEGPLVFSN